MHRSDLISKTVNDEIFYVKKRQKFKKDRPRKKQPNELLIEQLKQSVYLTKQQTKDEYIITNHPIVIDIDKFINNKKANIKNWTIDQVCDFIKTIPGCQKFESSFKDQVKLKKKLIS